MAEDVHGGAKAAPVVIKKYANRRLYDTATSAYVTLDILAAMVRGGIEFVVRDTKTDDDITRAVLTQILVEEEAKGQHLLSIGFLRQHIALYGDSLQSLVPQYLEVTMRSFSTNQDRIRDHLNDTFGGLSPFNRIEEIDRQNMQMFEQSVNMFSPPERGRRPDPGYDVGDDPVALDDLRAQLLTMQRRLDDLSNRRRD